MLPLSAWQLAVCGLEHMALWEVYQRQSAGGEGNAEMVLHFLIELFDCRRSTFRITFATPKVNNTETPSIHHER